MSRSGKILAIFSGLVLVVVVVVFAAVWYYASAIKDKALVVEREQDRVDLRVVSDSKEDGSRLRPWREQRRTGAGPNRDVRTGVRRHLQPS